MRTTNPMIRKLSNVEETGTDTDEMSYKGVAIKTVILLIVTLIGAGLYFVVHNYALSIGLEPITGQITLLDGVILIFALILGVISPFLAWVFKGAAGVFGFIYSLCQGYAIALLSFTYGNQYIPAIVMAVGLTILIVLVMLFLYVSRIVTVSKKFKTIITTLFIVMVSSGLLTFISGLIFPNNFLVQFLTSSNGIIGIICAVIGIIVASLFLLSDYSTIEEAVEDHRPKKYEWYAAFGLVFTIIWLYMKIFSLILRVEQQQK